MRLFIMSRNSWYIRRRIAANVEGCWIVWLQWMKLGFIIKVQRPNECQKKWKHIDSRPKKFHMQKSFIFWNKDRVLLIISSQENR
jgi:hypothetical protein